MAQGEGGMAFPATGAVAGLRALALEYVADLPDPCAEQSLLVMRDVLALCGWEGAALAGLLGMQTAACLEVIGRTAVGPTRRGGKAARRGHAVCLRCWG